MPSLIPLSVLMSDAEKISSQNANNASLNNALNVRPPYSVSPTSGTTVSIAITDSLVQQFDGLRIGLKPSTTTTASSYYQLAMNGGTSYPIAKPTGSYSDYITSLKVGEVYELVLTTVGGYTRWVCINYRDDLARGFVWDTLYGSNTYFTALNTNIAITLTAPSGHSLSEYMMYSCLVGNINSAGGEGETITAQPNSGQRVWYNHAYNAYAASGYINLGSGSITAQCREVTGWTVTNMGVSAVKGLRLSY